MIKQMFKMVWNRKRVNFLITVEIFFSFLVLFAVIFLAVYYTDNYRHPLGFSYENIWNVTIDVKQASDDYHTPEQVELTRQLFLAVKEFPEVEDAAGAHTAPYTIGSSSSVYRVGDREIRYEINEVTDGFKDVMGLTLVSGRWFGREDDGANFDPVVINRRLAREAFGTEDALGKVLSPPDARRESRVIGIVTDFRKSGEFAGLYGYVFERKDLNDAKQRPPRNLLVKVRPGTTAEFEEKLIRRLQAIARDWSFEIEPLVEMRASNLKLTLAPIIAVGLIAGFLMIMVGLGLTGVLWQNVTQRTREIGLRRAKGATAGDIYAQILGELLMITSTGLLVGVAVVVQFPLLDLIGFVSGKVFLYSLAISVLLIYGLTVVCGLYPSRLATRVHPAQALHYE
jgi:putative ABC transport system permease protein